MHIPLAQSFPYARYMLGNFEGELQIRMYTDRVHRKAAIVDGDCLGRQKYSHTRHAQLHSCALT